MSYGRRTFPPLSTFRTDIGLGLDFGGIGVYAAKSVSTPRRTDQLLRSTQASILSRATRRRRDLVVTRAVRRVRHSSAQDGGVRLEVAVTRGDCDRRKGRSITTANLLADANTRELLRNGFPTRIHFRLELWRKGGLFDDRRPNHGVGRARRVRSDEPDVQRRAPAGQRTVIENFGGFATVTTAEAQFDRPYRAPLHPNRSGRYYYNLSSKCRR